MSAQSSMRLSPRRAVTVAFLAISGYLFFETDSRAETWGEYARRWYRWQTLEEAQQEARETLINALSGPLIAMAFLAVVLAVFGPPYFEQWRIWISQKFRLNRRTQRELLITGFSVGITITNIVAWVVSAFEPIQLPIAILSCGATYVFFVQALPALSHSDASQRKAAFAALKSFAFLAAVLFVFTALLTKSGVAGMCVTPSAG